MEKIFTKERIIFGVLVLIALIVGFLVGNILFPKLNTPVQVDLKDTLNINESSNIELPTCSLFVEVSGAVNRPDVYCMNPNTMVIDAIKKASGFSKLYAKRYVSRNINLSSILLPNTKIYIPFQDEIIKENSVFDLKKIQEGGSSTVTCISINSASLEKLDSLTGVGPSTAQKIVEGRPYKQLIDLKNVSGIGDALFENIKSQICL